MVAMAAFASASDLYLPIILYVFVPGRVMMISSSTTSRRSLPSHVNSLNPLVASSVAPDLDWRSAALAEVWAHTRLLRFLWREPATGGKQIWER